MTKKQTHPQLPLDKAIRASVHYHIEADGTISQVINHILPTGEKKQIPVHATPHARVLITEKGLQAQFTFPRATMTIDEIVNNMYDESDEIMSWLQNEGEKAIAEAEKTFAEQAKRKAKSTQQIDLV